MPTVRIGPSYASLEPYRVNDDTNPTLVDSPHFTGYITVRLQNHTCDYEDPEKLLSTCPYFEGHRRYFSFQFQGRFKPTNPRRADHLWSFDDVMFCAETEQEIQPPVGSSLAVRFAKYIDPGFMADGMFNAVRPWAGSWVACGMNTMAAWRAEDSDNEKRTRFPEERDVTNGANGTTMVGDKKRPIYDNDKVIAGASSPLLPVGPWVYHGRHHLTENTRLILRHRGELNASQRRSYFSNEQARRMHVFDPSVVYACDFFNNFTDFSTMTARMMIRFNITNVLRNQPLRFVCRDKEGKSVFFVIEIDYSDVVD